ncbi:MAG: tetratricopeptide repeat protein [Thalassobaculaceae bacterium]
MAKPSDQAPSAAKAPRHIDYDRGLRLIPELVGAGRLDDAKRWAKRVLQAQPMDPRAWNQLALVEARQSRYESAEFLSKVATLIEPGAADLLVNRGNLVRMLGRQEQALSLFRWAQTVRPDDPEIDVAAALQLLTLGDHEAGLELYEHRWSRRKSLEGLAANGVPAWDGDVGSVKRILCVSEQGAGDAIQFVRYAESLNAAGVEVFVYCDDPLRRLLASAKGVARATTRFRPRAVDAAEMIMSLPYRLGMPTDADMAPGRYLDPPAHPYRIPRREGRPRVGICWAGNPNHRRDQQRSCPFEDMSPLLDVDGIDFYALQVGSGADAAEGDPRITGLDDRISDFADTAGLIDQLDLVITIDSAVAHMAGALDRPCWVLLHWMADWRWGQTGATTVWYPSVRLERRAMSQDWASFMPGIAARLAAWRDGWSEDAAG